MLALMLSSSRSLQEKNVKKINGLCKNSLCVFSARGISAAPSGAASGAGGKMWRLLSVWPFSSFPPQVSFLVGVAQGKNDGSAKCNKTTTFDILWTIPRNSHRKILAKNSAEFIIIIIIIRSSKVHSIIVIECKRSRSVFNLFTASYAFFH